MGENGWEPVEYAVFRKLDGNVIPGMPVRTLVMVGIALAIGMAIFLATGLVTHQVEQAMGYEDLSKSRDAYTLMRAAVFCEDSEEDHSTAQMSEADYLRSTTLKGCSDEEVSALASEGRSLGMTRQTTVAEATAMAPTTHMASECMVPMPYRLALALSPAFVVAVLFFELRGISLARELENAIGWSRAQKNYYHG